MGDHIKTQNTNNLESESNRATTLNQRQSLDTDSIVEIIQTLAEDVQSLQYLFVDYTHQRHRLHENTLKENTNCQLVTFFF